MCAQTCPAKLVGVVAVKGAAGKVRNNKPRKVGGVLSVEGTCGCRDGAHTQVMRGTQVVKNPLPAVAELLGQGSCTVCVTAA